jgi:hypothetical protein
MICCAKRASRIARVAILTLFVTALVAPRASADPIFTEAFVFPDTAPVNQNWYIGTESTFCAPNCLVYSASVLFDLANLTGAGGNPANVADYDVSLFDPALNFLAGPLPLATLGPSVDAQGFVAGTALSSATLSLALRGLDPENDSVRIEAFSVDGGGVIFQNIFSGVFSSTTVTIPFDVTMLTALSADGAFGIRITSFGPLDTRDFNLESAQLTATAVPEPASLVLLGAGLLGAAGAVRFRGRTGTMAECPTRSARRG